MGGWKDIKAGPHSTQPNASILEYGKIGRSSKGGPMSGGYMVVTFGPETHTDVGIQGKLKGACFLPFDCKIMAVGFVSESVTGTNSLAMRLMSSSDGTLKEVNHQGTFDTGTNASVGPGQSGGGIPHSLDTYVSREVQVTAVGEEVGLYGTGWPEHPTFGDSYISIDSRVNADDVGSALHRGSTHPWLIIVGAGQTGSLTTVTNTVVYAVVAPVSHINAKVDND